MAISQISIPVPADVATAYSLASEEQRSLALRVFADYLTPRSRAEGNADFVTARRRLSAEAKASGLTAEALEDILAQDG